MHRRQFLRGSAFVSGLGLAGAHVARAQGSTQLNTVLIGTGWWGMNIARVAMASGRCKLVALCDVDRNQLTPAAAEIERLSGAKPRLYGDFRELFAREKPAIAIVATPDHWHPLVTIAACRAGADVYVEKPISHTLLEGRAMVKAARDTGRIVQVGTHRRVSPHNVSAKQFLDEGGAGTIGMVRAFVHYGGGPGEITPDSDPPAGLDWDFWCGPGPLVPFNRRIHPRGFRRFLQFANGQLGDWGIHWMDQVLWCMGREAPRSVASMAARHILSDNTDAPDTQVVQFEFDGFTLVWEHRLYAANNAEKHNVGCYFYGTKGTLHLGWLDGWTFYPSDAKREPRHVDPQLHDPDKQNIPELWTDFLASIDSRKPPACDIELGHRSTSLSLLGMLAAKLGRSIQWDGRKEVIPDDPDANALLRREYRKPWVYPVT